jgi:glycosyltransferase involved in cell wall biosynthesis
VQITAIVPATNHPPTLPQSLNAIRAATDPPEQVVVVEDPAIRHPGTARNAGARTAVGDLLVFVDADVVVQPDVFVKFRQMFAADPKLVAAFGSYDDSPAKVGTVAEFRNLLHHHVHHEGAGRASTFWAGLGAVRRDAFERAGGYTTHPLEDVELGIKMSESGGVIILDPTIQGKHLKHWSLWTMMRTDLLVRGIPWVTLLLTHRGSASLSTLNLGWRHRINALVALALVAALPLRSLWLAAGAIVALVALNKSFYALLVRRLGVRAVGGIAAHVVHILVGVVAVPFGILAYYRSRQNAAR